MTEMTPPRLDPRGPSSTGKRKQKLVLKHRLLENNRKTSTYQPAELLSAKQYLKKKSSFTTSNVKAEKHASSTMNNQDNKVAQEETKLKYMEEHDLNEETIRLRL